MFPFLRNVGKPLAVNNPRFGNFITFAIFRGNKDQEGDGFCQGGAQQGWSIIVSLAIGIQGLNDPQGWSRL